MLLGQWTVSNVAMVVFRLGFSDVSDVAEVPSGVIVGQNFPLDVVCGVANVRTACPMVWAKDGMPLAPNNNRYTAKMKMISVAPMRHQKYVTSYSHEGPQLPMPINKASKSSRFTSPLPSKSGQMP